MAAYKTYVLVWVALLVLTAATVWVSYFNLGMGNAAVALVIASMKASLVAIFFMHLRHETRLVLGFAIFPLFVLALILFGTLVDVFTR